MLKYFTNVKQEPADFVSVEKVTIALKFMKHLCGSVTAMLQVTDYY